MVVKSARDSAADNATTDLDWPVIRGILAQTEMRTRKVIVGNVLGQDALKMRGAPNDNVVEALATDRANNPLNVSILPW